VLLKKFEAAKSRAKGRGKRARDGLDNDTDGERDELEQLGAWYKCGTWSVGRSHLAVVHKHLLIPG